MRIIDVDNEIRQSGPLKPKWEALDGLCLEDAFYVGFVMARFIQLMQDARKKSGGFSLSVPERLVAPILAQVERFSAFEFSCLPEESDEACGHIGPQVCVTCVWRGAT